MGFDTTASNTGQRKVAGAFLEKKFGRNILHHIYEIVVAALFNSFFGPSSGPQIPLFQRFSKSWPTIKKTEFKSLQDDRLNSSHNRELMDATVTFLKNLLMTKEGYMPRDDYRDLIQLCLI